MTEIGDILRRINELDLNTENQKDGWRMVDHDDCVWYTCHDDAEKRYQDHILRTDASVVRIVSIQPVDDETHNCQFCGAQLRPPADNSQAQTNQGNLQNIGMGDMAETPGGQGGVPGGGLF